MWDKIYMKKHSEYTDDNLFRDCELSNKEDFITCVSTWYEDEMTEDEYSIFEARAERWYAANVVDGEIR